MIGWSMHISGNPETEWSWKIKDRTNRTIAKSPRKYPSLQDARKSANAFRAAMGVDENGMGLGGEIR